MCVLRCVNEEERTQRLQVLEWQNVLYWGMRDFCPQSFIAILNIGLEFALGYHVSSMFDSTPTPS